MAIWLFLISLAAGVASGFFIRIVPFTILSFVACVLAIVIGLFMSFGWASSFTFAAATVFGSQIGYVIGLFTPVMLGVDRRVKSKSNELLWKAMKKRALGD